MAKYRRNLPQSSGGTFLSYVGMETDLIFNEGINLPGFASFPLLKSEEGRALLQNYYAGQIQLAQKHNLGVMLESPTWMANRDRGEPLGYTAEQLKSLNEAAIGLISKIRADCGDLPTLLSGQVGPRGDAYMPAEQMSIEEAAAYHYEQISFLEQTDADIISAYTICYVEEAVGIVKAAKSLNMPIAIAFTVETDGHLPTGMPLKDAIELVDAVTDGYPEYYLINCAHPDHFESTLVDGHWLQRLKGLVANASRCSHAELDEAEQLDDGNPVELAQQLADWKQKRPHLTILGGCCGTDQRHMSAIAEKIAE